MHFSMGFFIVITTLAFSLAVGIVYYVKWSHGFFRKKRIPHLEPKFFFGNCENPLKRTKSHWFVIKDIYDDFKRRGLSYGGFYMLTVPVILPVHLDVIRAILVKDYNNFTDRGLYVNDSKDLMGHGLFMLRGERWKCIRNKISPAFTISKIRSMMEIIAKCAEPMLQTVEKHVLEQEPLDAKEITSCFTTDVIGSCAFGIECNSFGEDHNQFRKHCKLFLETDSWRVAKLLFSNLFPRAASMLGLNDVRKGLNDFFNGLVRETVDFREKTNYRRNDFVQLLIDMKNDSDDAKRITYAELAAQIFTFFFAGFEASSTAAAFALFELSMQCGMQDRVRNEIREVLNGKELTYDAIQEMKYLGQVFDGKGVHNT